MVMKHVYTSVGISMLQAADESNKCEIELDSQADTNVESESCLIVHGQSRLVEVYDYYAIDLCKHAWAIDAVINKHTGHKHTLVLN